MRMIPNGSWYELLQVELVCPKSLLRTLSHKELEFLPISQELGTETEAVLIPLQHAAN